MISAWDIDHGISKSDFARGVARSAKFVVKPDKARRLKEAERWGTLHRRKGGALHEEVNRPAPWARKRRAAWDKGFNG